MSKKAPQNNSTTELTSPPDTVWVGKSDQAKSCGIKGLELDRMSTELQTHSVIIIQKKKLHDPHMRIQMCGADKGDMNGFLISKKDLEKALSLGFSLVQGGQ